MALQLNLHSIEHGGVAPLPAFLFAPANAIAVFLRLPIGYRLLSPVVLFRRSLVWILLPVIGWPVSGLFGVPAPLNEGRAFYYDFLLALAAVTLLRFAWRIVGFSFGQEVHSEEAGYSIVARILPLPVALTEQIVVPALLAWVGWWIIMRQISADLGLFLWLCAGSYLCLANWEARKRAAERRAPVDDKIRANAFAANIDRHEEKVTQSQRRQAGGKQVPLYEPGELPDVARPGRR